MTATAEQVEAAWHDRKLANVLYHDWEAASYDEKWSISFDQRCIDYARDRFTNIAGTDGWPYGTVLEVGCGTGFFLLNLVLAGVVDSSPSSGHVTDLSPGMVDVAQRNAKQLGFDIAGRVADAERIPYEDGTFDLVVGHAVLHHIPDVEQAFREVLRVLKPGGRFVFAGEPTKWGDYVARRLSRATWWLTTHLAPTEWRRPQAELDESSRAAALESVVDIHTFVPSVLEGMAVRAGAVDTSTKCEELTAAWFGWPVRTFEAAVPPERLGWKWSNFALKGWQRLSTVDKALSRIVPKDLYYNVEITGCKPS